MSGPQGDPRPNLAEDRRGHVTVLRVERGERLGALPRAMVEGLRG